MQNKIKTEFFQLARSQQEYLSQWYLESPAIITSNRYHQLQKLQQLLYKAIQYFIVHHEKFESIFPLSDKIRRIVDICRPYPYRMGTYRPDFLVEQGGLLKICEIGARFPLNGYFLSGIAEYIGMERYQYSSYLHQPQSIDFLHYLLCKYWGNPETLIILKGSDRPCDIKYYIRFFENLGIQVQTFSPEELRQTDLKRLSNSCVVNELNQMEMDMLDDNILQSIAASNALNDMRTIYLIHDKRFLAVLSDLRFLSECLNEEEVSFLLRYLIPTYTSIQVPEIWEQAKKEKKNWVIKHVLLGKSEQVYTGRTSTQTEWELLFDPSMRESMIIQPFIQQKQIQSAIKDQLYTDFVVGTLLCFDNEFFGTGLFRTSSFEITNRVDDRKMASCFTDDYHHYMNYFLL
ncbi:MAG: hypothetical protein LUH22_03350 [Bacteroides sp.]|nr:hypothetical protein [Bacteroides sp.]